MITVLREVGVPPMGIKVCGVMADLIPRHQIAALTTLLNAPFANTFGSTETGSPPCSGSLVPVGVVPETLPKKLSPLCEVKLVDADDREVPVGTPGEIAVRGPTLFSGYWQADEVNAQDFRHGWFHMGDILVQQTDGTFEFVDRAKYLIKSGGENIYPAEIEEVLLSEPRVAEAAVVRQADPQWGEVPIAFVARRDARLTAAELYRLCRQRLAGYKQPKGIRFIDFDDFPRSASGKVQRHELQARLEREP
jgi:acyl-CoA synthetase (AMP-forming)/AMP-acid ligase II